MPGDEALRALNGLTEDELVALALDEEEIDCRVRQVGLRDVILEPVSTADAGYIGSLGRAATLVARRARILGTVTRGPADGELEFHAGRADPLARRRDGRIDVELEVEVVPREPEAAQSAGAWLLQTVDVSIAGLGVRTGARRLAQGSVVELRLLLPGGSPVVGVARVVRAGDDRAGLEFSEIAPAQLARLAKYLIAANSAEAARTSSARTPDADPRRHNAAMSIVKINAITVPRERLDEFERRFASRAGRVSSAEGFEAFELLRPNDDRDVCLVITRWRSEEDFQAWVGSEDFRAGHAQHRTDGPVGTASELWSFDVLELEGPAPG